VWAPYVGNFQKNAKSKQSHNGRKLAQSGHPDSSPGANSKAATSNGHRATNTNNKKMLKLAECC
jgi:hypothetical protein